MTSKSFPAELLEARKDLDRIDREIIGLLAERFSLTHKVGVVKAANALPPVDANREAEKLAELRRLSEQQGLDPDLVAEIFRRIMEEVVKNHRHLAEQA